MLHRVTAESPYTFTYYHPPDEQTLSWQGTVDGYVLVMSSQALLALPRIHAVAAYFRNYRPPKPVEVALGSSGLELVHHYTIICQQLEQRTEEQEAIIATATATLVLRIRQIIRQALPFDGRTQPYRLVGRFTELVERHFSERADLTFYARELGISADYLSKVCSTKLGKRAKDLIQARQFEEAQHLLQTTGMRIKEIAGIVGFANPNYFSRAFTQYCGISPEEYRKGFN